MGSCVFGRIYLLIFILTARDEWQGKREKGVEGFVLVTERKHKNLATLLEFRFVGLVTSMRRTSDMIVPWRTIHFIM